MKNHGTVATLDVPDDGQFPQAVEQAWRAAARRFGYGAPQEHFFDIDVNFLACSDRGDVYVVHVHDPSKDETASVRLTQLTVLHGTRQVPLGKKVSVFADGPKTTDGQSYEPDGRMTDWGPN